MIRDGLISCFPRIKIKGTASGLFDTWLSGNKLLLFCVHLEEAIRIAITKKKTINNSVEKIDTSDLVDSIALLPSIA